MAENSNIPPLTIGDKTHPINSLSEIAKQQITNYLQIVDTEIQHFQQHLGIAYLARASFIATLQAKVASLALKVTIGLKLRALGQWLEPVRGSQIKQRLAAMQALFLPERVTIGVSGSVLSMPNTHNKTVFLIALSSAYPRIFSNDSHFKSH